jgi:hypothetical protein
VRSNASERIFLATYPAMQKIFQSFDPGFFDLIIADESHRSIYNVYGDIFRYFDCHQIGLTATPVDYVTKSTFRLFDCEGLLPFGGCLAESRERYYEPVRRHLRPYLNELFPGAELELGDGFTIAGMKRSRSESFKRLSGGTQEQIAVLVRLAIGTLLAERDSNVPIILDDALVYCDDDRINLMFDALSRAGKHQQIIVLTCRLRSFAPLGGHTLRVQMDGECP